MPPAAGRFNQRITIEAVQRVSDGGGGYEETWQPLVPCWAEVLPLAGLERLTAQQQESTVDYKVTIRWRAGLTAEMRVKWRTLTLNVKGIGDAGPQSGEIILYCETEGPR